MFLSRRRGRRGDGGRGGMPRNVGNHTSSGGLARRACTEGGPPTPQLASAARQSCCRGKARRVTCPQGQGAAGGWGDKACVRGGTADGDEGAGRWGRGPGPAGCAGKATGARFWQDSNEEAPGAAGLGWEPPGSLAWKIWGKEGGRMIASPSSGHPEGRLVSLTVNPHVRQLLPQLDGTGLDSG